MLLGHVTDGCGSTAPADVVGKPFGVVRIVGEPFQLFLLHALAAPAIHATEIEFEIDPRPAARQIANLARLAVIPAAVNSPTNSADRFFERRVSRITLAWRSPNSPLTVVEGRKPGKR